MPTLGQDAVGIRVVVDPPLTTVLDATYIREGTVLIVIKVGAGAGLDHASIIRIARQADEKVRQVLGQ